MKRPYKFKRSVLPALVFIAIMTAGYFTIRPFDESASLEPIQSIEKIELASSKGPQTFNPSGMVPAQADASHPLPDHDVASAPKVSFTQVTEMKPHIQSFTVNAQEASQIRYDRSGTIIRIPPNSLIDDQGNLVRGEVEITYREFRDAPDFVLSDIPMTYTDDAGTPYRFSSTGMFEIRAAQKGKNVHVREGAAIDMEFAMTSVEPNTNFYAYSDATSSWTEIGVVTEKGVEIDEKKAKKVVRKKPLVKNWELQLKEGDFIGGIPYMGHIRVKSLRTETDTASTVQRVIRDGQTFAKRSGKNIFRYRYPFDTKSYRSRHGSTKYWQTTKKSEVKTEDAAQYEVVKISLDSTSSRHPHITLEFQNGYCADLDGFENFAWKIDNAEKVVSKLKQPFYGFQPRYSSKFDKYYFRLKGKDHFVTVSAVPVDFRKVKKDSIQWAELDLTAYRQAEKGKRKVFDRTIANKKQEYDQQKHTELDEFWRYSSLWMGGKEMAMTKKNWLEHFRENPKLMKKRYKKVAESDWAHPEETAALIEKRMETLTKFKQRMIDKYGQMQHNQWLEWVWIGPEDQNPRGNQNFQEWNDDANAPNLSNRQSTMLASGMDEGHTYPELVRNLNVGNFGVYNCDQIYQVKNNRQIMAMYVDEKGDTLHHAAIVSLIDYQFNGAFSFEPSRITYNPDSKNAFVLFCEGKETYIAEPEAFASAEMEDGVAVFRVKNMTETVKTTDQLREVLRL